MIAALMLAAATAVCPQPAQTASPHTIQIVAPQAVLFVRVADTAATQDAGLMCVRAMPVHTGMLFVFSGGDKPQDFWMENTLIPLDMVFVRHDGTVDSVAADVPASTPDQSARYDVARRSGTGSFVIELNAGEAARDGIARGAHLIISP